jgi:hypothetical protein
MSERSERSKRAIESALSRETADDVDAEAESTRLAASRDVARPQTGAVRRRPESPWGQIAAGFGLALIGGLAIATGIDWAVFVGFVMIGLGGAFSMIGVVAAGVRLGMQWASYDRSE